MRNVDPLEADSGFDKLPYISGHSNENFIADRNTKNVRVYADGVTNQGGRWMMSADEIAGLYPSQIKDKFDLPELPAHITDVTPPKNTLIRTGTVNRGNFGGDGGGIQFELRSRIPNEVFTNPRPL